MTILNKSHKVKTGIKSNLDITFTEDSQVVYKAPIYVLYEDDEGAIPDLSNRSNAGVAGVHFAFDIPSDETWAIGEIKKFTINCMFRPIKINATTAYGLTNQATNDGRILFAIESESYAGMNTCNSFLDHHVQYAEDEYTNITDTRSYIYEIEAVRVNNTMQVISITYTIPYMRIDAIKYSGNFTFKNSSNGIYPPTGSSILGEGDVFSRISLTINLAWLPFFDKGRDDACNDYNNVFTIDNNTFAYLKITSYRDVIASTFTPPVGGGGGNPPAPPPDLPSVTIGELNIETILGTQYTTRILPDGKEWMTEPLNWVEKGIVYPNDLHPEWGRYYTLDDISTGAFTNGSLDGTAWRLPTVAEWSAMAALVVDGNKLKSTTGWPTDADVSASTGELSFNALPSGKHASTWDYTNVLWMTMLWDTAETTVQLGVLSALNSDIVIGLSYRSHSVPVRLIRDRVLMQ